MPSFAEILLPRPRWGGWGVGVPIAKQKIWSLSKTCTRSCLCWCTNSGHWWKLMKINQIHATHRWSDISLLVPLACTQSYTSAKKRPCHDTWYRVHLTPKHNLVLELTVHDTTDSTWTSYVTILLKRPTNHFYNPDDYMHSDDKSITYHANTISDSLSDA